MELDLDARLTAPEFPADDTTAGQEQLCRDLASRLDRWAVKKDRTMLDPREAADPPATAMVAPGNHTPVNCFHVRHRLIGPRILIVNSGNTRTNKANQTLSTSRATSNP